MITNNKILFTFLLIALINSCTSKRTTTIIDTSQNKVIAKDTIEFYKEEAIRYDNYIYNENIKSVFIHKKGVELAEPMIVLNTNESLILRFDELDADFNTYQYKFIHCNANWEADNLNELDYIDGFNELYIDYYKNSFNTSQAYVHYMIEFPNDDVKLIKSGNYIIIIYPEDNPDDVIITQKFYVAEQIINPEINVKYPSDIDQKYYRQEVDFSFLYNPQNIINPYSNIKVYIQQNHREDNAISGLKPNFIRDNKLVYNYDDENVFDGANEFRYINMTNFSREIDRIQKIKFENGKYHLSLLKDIRRSFKRYLEIPDINGKYLIKTDNGNDWNLEGDYAKVKFTLPYKNALNKGDLYIYGQLSSWKIDGNFQMKYNDSIKAYQKELYLKQGYYNYMYLYANDTSSKADVRLIEGSHFDTENDYLFKVYYSDPGKFYDRLLLYHVSNSRKGF